MEFEPEYDSFPARDTARLTFGAHLTAPTMMEDKDRAIVSLSAVLDRSGSMAGNKLALVKRTSDFMMQQLSAKDKLGIIQYDDQVQELLNLARTSENFKREAKVVVDRMVTGGCTNLSGGLFKGVEQQQRNKYIDYDALSGPGGPSDDPSENPSQNPSSPRSIANSDFTDVGSEISNFEVVEPPTQQALGLAQEDLVQQMPLQNAVHTMPLQQQTQHMPIQQQMQMPIQMQAPLQAPNAPPQRSPSMMQRVTQLFSRGVPSTTSSSHISKAKSKSAQPTTASGRAGEIASLLKDGKPPKFLQVESDAVRSVFLFTDGLANEGIQDPNQLVSVLQRMLDRSPRVRVYTFGYGSDHSPDLLQRIAAAGSGTYYFIENEEAIPTAFADALGGLLSVAAQNVTVEFVPGPGVTVSQVHTSFNTIQGSDGSRSISVGDLFSEEVKDLLFDVDLPALMVPDDDFFVGTLRVSYLDVAGACIRTDEVRCTVKRPDELAAERKANPNITMQKARIATAQALAEAKKEADAGRYEEARQRVQGTISLMQEAQEQARGNEKHEALTDNLCRDLTEALTNMESREVYVTKGSKIMCSKAMGHAQQRTAALEAEEEWADEGAPKQAFSYANANQMQMRRKAKAWFSGSS